MRQGGKRPQGRKRHGLAWTAAVLAIAGLAVALAAALPVRAQQVAQSSDFFLDQEKLRRQTQQIRRGQATTQPKRSKRTAAHPKKKKTRHVEKPKEPVAKRKETERKEKEPATTGTIGTARTERAKIKPAATAPAKKPPSPKSQEARRSKPKLAEDEPKKEPKKELKKNARVGHEIPPGLPTYIRVKPAPVIKSLGADIAHKIFSHEFTSVRQLAISHSASVIPGYECPRDPAVALTDVVPFKVKPGVTSWIEGYVVGCKPRTKRSFLVMLEDNKPQFAELLPGLSIADPLLQRDAVPGAQASAKAARPEGCEKSVVSDTRLAEPLTAAGRPWVELWTLDQCGTEHRIEMRFTPSKEGGTRWAAKLIK